MKKNSSLKRIVLFAVIGLSYSTAQSQNQLRVSVTGIEYANPAFALLKESIEKSKKASSVKQSYDQSTGTLTVLYKGDAQELWNEIPKSTQAFFKVTTLNDNRIVLGLANETGNTNKASTVSTKDDDCKNCYWKICNYDLVKSFEGKLYKGINYDNGTFYFNCDNGVLVRKAIIVNGYGTVTNIQTDTLLMSEPVGARWGVFNYSSDNGLLTVMTGHRFFLVQHRRIYIDRQKCFYGSQRTKI